MAGSYSNLEFDLETGRRGRRTSTPRPCSGGSRRRGRDGSQQQRRGDAADARRPSPGPGGHRLARGTGGDRRRLPRPRRDGAIWRETARGRHDEPHPHRRLPRCDRPRHGAAAQVHRSNFRIEGFTEQPSSRELVALGRERGSPSPRTSGAAISASSGRRTPHARHPPAGEPRVQASVEAGDRRGLLQRRQAARRAAGRHHRGAERPGVDDQAASADAGTPRGQADLRGARGDARRVRGRTSEPDDPDSADGPGNTRRHPGAGHARGRTRAGRRDPETEVVPGQSAVGGGTTPGLELPTWVIALRRQTKSADWLDGWLRQQEVPVVGRIERDRLLLDLRTVLAEEDDLVAETLARIP